MPGPSQAPGTSRVGVIDIGTNSTRLLLADVSDGRVSEIERRSRVTRLGRGVDYSGQLSSEAIEAVCETVAEYVAICERAGSGVHKVVATSAVRDAENGGAFVAELRERFALTAEVLSGEEEARLTYLGATSERDGDGSLLVVDIGGGSTEIIVGSGEKIVFHTSLQAGVVRHTERRLISDPPTQTEMEALSGDIEHLIEAEIPSGAKIEVESAVAVAGTPSSLAAIDMELEPFDPDAVQGHRLSLSTIQKLLARLATVPLERRREIVGMHPDRAPTIVAGVVILIEVMRAFGLEEVEVSDHDILYGSAITAAGSA